MILRKTCNKNNTFSRKQINIWEGGLERREGKNQKRLLKNKVKVDGGSRWGDGLDE